MNNSVKKVVASILCILLVLQAAACGKKNSEDPANTGKTLEISGATVWSAPSTVKVQKDDIDYENKGAAQLHYNAVRNEYESYQLIITATKDITSYDLEINDLKNGDNILSKENIEVYSERYIYAEGNVYDAAYMPDPLVPLDAAREYGDLTIAKDTNAAFWITVYVPKETPAGVYEGTFKLKVDKGTADIPVKVTVNDYTLTDESNARTLFSWRNTRMAAGELDSTIEMVTAYYEFFLDYRISLQTMPLETLSGEEFAACVEKYYDRLSSYCFMSQIGDMSGTLHEQEEDLKEQIYAVAEMSSPEQNYFEKAMIYLIDEPDLQNATMQRAHLFDYYATMNELLVKIADEMASDTTGRFASFKQIKNWRSYIEDIPNIVPTGSDWVFKNMDSERVQSFFDLINCFCPYWSAIQGYPLEYVDDMKETYDMDIWWYGCTNPKAPGATYHVNDTNLLSARSITWLQKKLNISGNLYWGSSMYSSEESSQFNQYIDIWNGARIKDVFPVGDGNLTYPGAAYGLYGPIPSMRLMSIRDGNEEYEMLLDVENSYKEMVEAKGIALDVNNAMEPFYASLSDGNFSMYADGQFGLDFATLRASLIDTAVLAGKDIGFALQIGDAKDNVVPLSYYLTGDCKVSINGKAQTPVEGNRYEYALNLEEQTSLTFTFETADGSYSIEKFIGNPIYILQALSNESVLSNIKVPENSTAQLVNTTEYSTDGTSVLMNVNGLITGDELDDSLYTPVVEISTSMFEGIENLAEVSEVALDIYNPGESFTFNASIYSGSTYVQMGTYSIANGKNTISLNIKDADFDAMDKADKITFIFENTSDGVTANSYKFYIDNIVKKQ